MNISTARVVETPRLRLIRIKDPSLTSEDLQWFHECWVDPVATSWSLHGRCETLEASSAWFAEQLATMDNIIYVVFVKDGVDGKGAAYPGELVGNIGLRKAAEPELPVFAHPDGTVKTLNLRTLGYSFLQKAWGKGYATETAKAMLGAYVEGVKEKKDKEAIYIEAIWSPENVASGKVLGKLGFKQLGYKEEERVWLAGDWRYGYNVSGLYL